MQNSRLRGQLQEAVDPVVANIAEGFEQPTDRAFAAFLFHAKASAGEVRARLALAHRRKYISEVEARRAAELGQEVCRMLTGLIKYLLRSNRPTRGLGPPTRPTG